MVNVLVKFNRTVNDDELKEVMSLAENQRTSDKYRSASLHINGNYAVIDVDIDDDGDITVL